MKRICTYPDTLFQLKQTRKNASLTTSGCRTDALSLVQAFEFLRVALTETHPVSSEMKELSASAAKKSRVQNPSRFYDLKKCFTYIEFTLNSLSF